AERHDRVGRVAELVLVEGGVELSVDEVVPILRDLHPVDAAVGHAAVVEADARRVLRGAQPGHVGAGQTGHRGVRLTDGVGAGEAPEAAVVVDAGGEDDGARLTAPRETHVRRGALGVGIRARGDRRAGAVLAAGLAGDAGFAGAVAGEIAADAVDAVAAQARGGPRARVAVGERRAADVVDAGLVDAVLVAEALDAAAG